MFFQFGMVREVGMEETGLKEGTKTVWLSSLVQDLTLPLASECDQEYKAQFLQSHDFSYLEFLEHRAWAHQL